MAHLAICASASSTLLTDLLALSTINWTEFVSKYPIGQQFAIVLSVVPITGGDATSPDGA
jgi:hypothetical protein